MDAHIEGVYAVETPNGPITIVTLGVGEHDDVLPIFVGLEEGTNIARGLDAADIGRPLTHDLLLDIVEGTAGSEIVDDPLRGVGAGLAGGGLSHWMNLGTDTF